MDYYSSRDKPAFHDQASQSKKKQAIKKALHKQGSILAENEGFEPPVPCGTTVFKTAAFDHSANSPMNFLF